METLTNLEAWPARYVRLNQSPQKSPIIPNRGSFFSGALGACLQASEPTGVFTVAVAYSAIASER